MMLPQFVSVLLQVLIHKSHDLLQEEIGIAVYNMASVDFSTFFSAFLPEFLTGCQGLDTNQKNVLGRNFKMERVRSPHSTSFTWHLGGWFRTHHAHCVISCQVRTCLMMGNGSKVLGREGMVFLVTHTLFIMQYNADLHPHFVPSLILLIAPSLNMITLFIFLFIYKTLFFCCSCPCTSIFLALVRTMQPILPADSWISKLYIPEDFRQF